MFIKGKIIIPKFSNESDEALRRYRNLKIAVFLSLIILKQSGKLSELKLCGVTVAELKKCGFELIWFNVYSALLCHLPSKIRFVFRSLQNTRKCE